MIRMTKIVSSKYVIDEYPKTCDDCPFLSSRRYQCHNDRGVVYDCQLGFMLGCDTRDYPVGKRRFDECHIEKLGNVVIDYKDPTDIVKAVEVEHTESERRCCVEYNGKQKVLCFSNEFFEKSSDDDLMYLARRYFFKHLDLFD